ncbi:MAG TPA: hypothetical protein VEY09_05095 [Pyrinomonadaceae bacterium]|nr:hypothetical protein [Pyrinomonadaceae bacterium]
MPDKRSKYDTDPLDPNFVRRTDEVFGRTAEVETDRPTEPFRPEPFGTEPLRPEPRPAEPTRRFDEQIADSYPSVFIPPPYQSPPPPRNAAGLGAVPHQPPAVVQPPPPGPHTPYDPQAAAGRRKVAKLGLEERVAIVLPYAPFYIGLVAALIELLVVPREETRTRFHAAQGLALQLAILAGAFAFGIVSSVTNSGLGGTLFGLASFIFLLVSMWRVWEGKPHHVAPLEDATAYLDRRITPTR